MTATDSSVTRTDLAEALTHMCQHAKQQPCIVKVPNDAPTKWDDAHAKLDGMLTAWQRATTTVTDR